MDIIELILKIEINRRLYVGDDDITALEHFLGGYCFCCQLHGIDYNEKRLNDFMIFIYNEYDEKRSISIFQCIKENSNTIEEEYDNFFNLVHKYLNN